MDNTLCKKEELSTEARAVRLREEHVFYGGMHLCYRLDAVTVGESVFFSLTVTHGSERVTLALGEDVLFAGECLRVLRDGAVTPVSAEEVLEDLRYVYKKEKKI